MANILSDVDITIGKHCLYSSIKNVLSYYKFNINEDEVFFLCDGINIGYSGNLSPLGYFNYIQLIQNISNNLSISTDYSFAVSDNDFINIFSKAISSQDLIIVFLNIGYLSYITGEKDTRNNHCVLLYGIDIEEDKAYIGDSYYVDQSGKVFKYIGTLSLKEMIKGIRGYILIKHSKFKELNRKNFIPIVKKSIDSFLEGSISNGSNCSGIIALKRYFNDMSTIIDIDDSTFRQKCFSTYYSLKIESVILILSYIQSYIKENFSIDDDIYIRQIEDVSKEWQKNAFNIYKTGMTFNREKIPKIIQKANENIEILEKILRDISEYIVKPCRLND